jgi:acyl-CoA synthetase (NDP forming)
LFDPRSVAIVGASGTAGKWGNWLARVALNGEHRRSVYLVNRSGHPAFGRPTYRNLAELPEPAEMVVIAIGAQGFEAAVDDALGCGAKAIVAITAGLGESSAEGLATEKRVAERVRAAGAILVGPNCLGVADTGSELTVAYSEFTTGPLGLVSQSGNLALEVAAIARRAGLGFSRFVSVGNQADLEIHEVIDELAGHDLTRVIAVYAEDFRDGRAFARAALSANEAGKPVILLTVGSSRAGARAAQTHTGAIVSASAAVDAACAASGMMRVATPHEMVDVAQALLMPHPPRGRRIGICGDGGGHVALAADLAAAHDLDVPALTGEVARRLASTLPPAATTTNPVDFAGGGERDFFNYARVVEVLAKSGEVDAVVLTGYFGGYGEESAEFAGTEANVATAMADAAEAAGCALVVQTMFPTSSASRLLRSRQVPVYADIDSAVRVLARVVARAHQSRDGVPDLPPANAGATLDVDYFGARELIASAGIPFVDARPVRNFHEARAAATAMGYPVVLKALASVHKSDGGGVRVGIASPGELEAAFAAMSARIDATTFSLERMAPAGGVELLVGVQRDHSFGPIVAVGLGGVYTEIIRDVSVALAPVSEDLAARMIRSLRAAPLLLGGRGGAPVDVAAAARCAALLSELVAARSDIAEAEINPLLIGIEGAVGLDARVGASIDQATTAKQRPPHPGAPEEGARSERRL